MSKKGYYVYKFIDMNENIIYIGKTINLNSRLTEAHFTNNGHLPKECYDYTKQVFYSKLDNSDEMSIYERYLINKHNPKYNTQYNNRSSFRFELPKLKWIEFKNIIHENLNIRKLKNTTKKHILNETLSREPTIDEVIIYNIKKYISKVNYNYGYLNKNNMRVACIDLYTLKTLYIYENHEEAGKDVGVSKDNIRKTAKQHNTCGGYYWRFLKDVI